MLEGYGRNKIIGIVVFVGVVLLCCCCCTSIIILLVVYLMAGGDDEPTDSTSKSVDDPADDPADDPVTRMVSTLTNTWWTYGHALNTQIGCLSLDRYGNVNIHSANGSSTKSGTFVYPYNGDPMKLMHKSGSIEEVGTISSSTADYINFEQIDSNPKSIWTNNKGLKCV